MMVPKLRFPEFRELWKANRLGVISDSISSGKDKSDSDGKYDLYGSTGVIGKTSSDTYSGQLILVARVGANAGLLTRANGNFGVTDNTLVIHLKNSFQINFIFYYLERLDLNSLVFGSGQPLITGKQLKSLLLFLPDSSEQQKIADCLTSIDDRITAETQKLDSLKAHKKGLMQQLFPAEGQTQPKLRFPEFHDNPKWEKKKLGDMILKSFYGTSSATSDTGKYPVLRMGDMSNGKLDFSNLVYITLDDSDFKRFSLKKGDILLNRNNSYDLVGKVSIFESEIECLTASYIVTYRLNQSKLNPTFCNNLLNTSPYQNQIKTLATKSVSQANINPTTFKEKVIIYLPKLDEQKKNANCFASLDDLITAQTQEVEILKAHKKGLMQQLFPSLGEVKR
ncbi:MAG: restriction endonuclease subunit S [Cyanobacteria bacterium P01_F01_bin.150]